MARFRQQTDQTTSTQPVFVQNDAGVNFTQGLMNVGGTPQVPVESQQWRSSNGITVYTTVKWRNPNTGELRTSCNCPAWTIKKGSNKRSCAHTKDMEGTDVCTKERVSPAPVALVTPADVAKHVPTIMMGSRELRAIMLDD